MQKAKRRTTVALRAELLTQARRIARTRRVNLSTVISEALADGLRMHAVVDRSEEVLSSCRKAFDGFSGEELLLLDGVVLEPAAKHR
jgi:hypothetical protein